MTGIIIALVVGATILVPMTAWLLSLNAKVSRMDDSLEAMTVASSEWQRLEHMSLDELEDNRENYKTPYNVGEKFKVGVTLGEQGFFDEGKCNALTGTYASESPNCFKDTILTVFDANGNSLYTTRSLPLSAGGGDNFPEGTILPYTGDLANIPKGWVLCDGTNGTPDLTDRFLQGTKTTTGEFREAGLPNITGIFTQRRGHDGNTFSSTSGAFYDRVQYPSGTTYQSGSNNLAPEYVYFNASRSSAVYGKSETVQPKAFTVFYIMKTNQDFHYDHTNGFVSPDYYTKDEVDSLLDDERTKSDMTYLAENSKKYIRNVTENNTLAMGYNDSSHIVQMYVDNTERTALPRGTILPYAGKIADIPTGWYVCDGDNGTPKLFGRVLQSYDESHNVGDFVEAGLPNMTGSTCYGLAYSYEGYDKGVFYPILNQKVYSFQNYSSAPKLGFDAERGRKYWHQQTYGTTPTDTIFGNSPTVQPPAYIVCYIIKLS